MTNSTWATVRFVASLRMPAPLPSGTRARVSVRFFTVTSLPLMTSMPLPAHALSVISTLSASPTPSMVMFLVRTMAQSKYSPGWIITTSPGLAAAIASEGIL